MITCPNCGSTNIDEEPCSECEWGEVETPIQVGDTIIWEEEECAECGGYGYMNVCLDCGEQFYP